jgi:hypothetical protein
MYQYFQYTVLCKYHKLFTERLRYLQKKKILKPIISLFTIKTKVLVLHTIMHCKKKKTLNISLSSNDAYCLTLYDISQSQ